MNAGNLRAPTWALVIGYFAFPVQCRAQLTGTIEAKRIEFVNGKPSLAEGIGTVKNEKGETIAAGALLVSNGTMGLLGKKGASFTFAVSPTAPPPTEWPGTAPLNVAQVDFDGNSRWTLKDDLFLFLLEVGGGFQANIAVDRSLLSSSNINFPEGTYVMWQHSITVGPGGGSVVFKQGHPVDGDNTTVETPENKKLKFPRKGNGATDTTQGQQGNAVKTGSLSYSRVTLRNGAIVLKDVHDSYEGDGWIAGTVLSVNTGALVVSVPDGAFLPSKKKQYPVTVDEKTSVCIDRKPVAGSLNAVSGLVSGQRVSVAFRKGTQTAERIVDQSYEVVGKMETPFSAAPTRPSMPQCD
jgi:hypothetical protein